MIKGANELLQYCFATCILMVPVFCGLERTCTPEVKALGPHGVCGGQLTNLLTVACMLNGGYNSRYFKRSSNPGSSNDYTASKGVTDHGVVEPSKTVKSDIITTLEAQLVSKRQAYSFLQKKSEINEQGVVCECCYFRCSFSELTGYCSGADGSTVFDFYKKRSQSADKTPYSSTNSRQIITDLDNINAKDDELLAA